MIYVVRNVTEARKAFRLAGKGDTIAVRPGTYRFKKPILTVAKVKGR